jgi:Opioid growth factor receptor (OGFr) conserved region
MNDARSPILEFLAGSGPDASGRFLRDILAYTDTELELRHDYIQWLFPLDTQSLAVPSSPVLTPSEIAAIQGSGCACENMTRAAERMARFYRENDHWLIPVDHNHKRITRIIKSLRMLVGQREAESFYTSILSRVGEAGDRVTESSQRYWQEAVGLR